SEWQRPPHRSNWRQAFCLWPDRAERSGSRLGRAVLATYESGTRTARRIADTRFACAARGYGLACPRSCVDEAASSTAPLWYEVRDSAQPHAPAIEAVRRRATRCRCGSAAASLYFSLMRRLPTKALVQCTLCRHRHKVHKHRNLLAHAPEKLHDEITADYTDMIYADSAHEIEKRRRAFLRKWRVKCRAVADSLEEAGD